MKPTLPFSAEAAPPAPIRTLLVDDCPAMLKLLHLILKRAGDFDVVGTATNGSQGLQYASALCPDLVLMDVNMPKLNGIDAARWIKRSEPSPVVVMITSDDDPFTRARAEEAGADGFVTKGGDLRSRLLATLQDIFGPGESRNRERSDVCSHNS